MARSSSQAIETLMKNTRSLLSVFAMLVLVSGCAADTTQTSEDVAAESSELGTGNAWGILFYPIAIPFESLDAPAVRFDKDRGYGKFHGFKKQLGNETDGERLLIRCVKPDLGASSCEIYGAGRITLKDPTRAPANSGERAPLTSTLVGDDARHVSRSLPVGQEIRTNNFSLSCESDGASCTPVGIAVYAGPNKF
jgi:hypothetical protein